MHSNYVYRMKRIFHVVPTSLLKSSRESLANERKALRNALLVTESYGKSLNFRESLNFRAKCFLFSSENRLLVVNKMKLWNVVSNVAFADSDDKSF